MVLGIYFFSSNYYSILSGVFQLGGMAGRQYIYNLNRYINSQLSFLYNCFTNLYFLWKIYSLWKNVWNIAKFAVNIHLKTAKSLYVYGFIYTYFENITKIYIFYKYITSGQILLQFFLLCLQEIRRIWINNINIWIYKYNIYNVPKPKSLGPTWSYN